MKMRTSLSNAAKAAATIAALGLALTACASNEAPAATSTTDTTTASVTATVPALSGTLNAGGSTAQTAAQDAWRAGFQAANAGVTVNYDPVGSGAGRTGFASGSYVVIGTDDAFSATELSSTTFTLCATSDIVEVPAYISPVAVAFNLPGITSLILDANTAASLLSGKIKTWNDPAIAALNPGVTLPSTAVTPVFRSDKSGTTGNVTDYLSKAAPSVWTYGMVENWPTDLTGDAANGTQGVVAAITGAAGTVGYVDFSQTTGLGVASLINAGSPVAPNAAGATKTLSASTPQTGRSATDLAYDVNRTPSDPTAYPMIMVSYEVACAQYKDPANAALAKAYMSYVVSTEGQTAAAGNAGSAPLSSDATVASAVATAVAAIS
ncbi:MAG: phosphate ABC transporter substrate-binding protein PstS [Propionibacteriaceae bacterium]|nr:phosphate ABC transporter substrate-binding protein PstS [Propionibacteriaceae bacterium]